MRKIIGNQFGVTLIETVVSTAIIAIILLTIIMTLLFGQKMIILADTKNNAASLGQEQIDEIMANITLGSIPDSGSFYMVDGHKVYSELTEVDKNKDGTKEGYDIKIQIYYNNDEAYIEMKAYAKKNGVGV